jgi:hypothetical protein
MGKICREAIDYQANIHVVCITGTCRWRHADAGETHYFPDMSMTTIEAVDLAALGWIPYHAPPAQLTASNDQ